MLLESYNCPINSDGMKIYIIIFDKETNHLWNLQTSMKFFRDAGHDFQTDWKLTTFIII